MSPLNVRLRGLCAGICALAALPAMGAEPSLEEVISAVEARAKSFETLHVSFYWATYRVPAGSELQPVPANLAEDRAKYSFVRSGDQMLLQRTFFNREGVEVRSMTTSFDGKVSRTLNTAPNREKPGAVLRAGRSRVFSVTKFRTGLQDQVFDFDEPLHRFLRAGRAQLARTSAENIAVVLVDVPVDPANPAGDALVGTVTIDLAQGALCTEIDLSIEFRAPREASLANIRQRMYDVQVSHSGGLAYISSAKLLVYNPNVSRDTYVTIFECSDCRADFSPDPALFLMPVLPPNTEVFDAIANVGYEIGNTYLYFRDPEGAVTLPEPITGWIESSSLAAQNKR